MDNIIKIVPIFDQSAPSVWDDFARIQRETLSGVYNIGVADGLCNGALDSYMRDWRDSGAFAFGAYDTDKMVGFIRGNIERSSVYIAGVYVLPKYRGLRLGTRLLNAAERSASLATSFAELHAIDGAETFYAQRHIGYTCSYSNVYTKQIRHMGACGVVPIFRLNPSLSRVAKQMLEPYDIRIERYMPAFMYMDSDFKPLGIAVAKSDKFHNGTVVIASNTPKSMANMVNRQLTSVIKPFTNR